MEGVGYCEVISNEKFGTQDGIVRYIEQEKHVWRGKKLLLLTPLCPLWEIRQQREGGLIVIGNSLAC